MSFPTTDAIWSIALSPGGSRSMRAASTALHRGRDLDGQQGPRQPVAAALAAQGPGLDEDPHALFQEERVPLRPRDQHPLERLEGPSTPSRALSNSSALSAVSGSIRS